MEAMHLGWALYAGAVGLLILFWSDVAPLTTRNLHASSPLQIIRRLMLLIGLGTLSLLAWPLAALEWLYRYGDRPSVFGLLAVWLMAVAAGFVVSRVLLLIAGPLVTRGDDFATYIAFQRMTVFIGWAALLAPVGPWCVVIASA